MWLDWKSRSRSATLPSFADGRSRRQMAVSMASVEADAAGAWDKGNDDGSPLVVCRGGAHASEDVEDFLLQSGLGHPFRVARLNEPLVVSGGNLAADDNEKDFRIAGDCVGQI